VLSLGACWSVLLKVSNLTVHIPGLEISPTNFKKLMFNRSHEFVYPPEGLFKLRGILT
jgi:hypothetical protein